MEVVQDLHRSRDTKSARHEWESNSSSQEAYTPSSIKTCLTAQAESKRLSFYSSKLSAAIHSSDIVGLLSLSQAISFIQPDESMWWLNIMDSTEKEITALANTFCLHDRTADAIRNRATVEKIEGFGHYYFACIWSLRSPGGDTTSFGSHRERSYLYAIVFGDGIITLGYHYVVHAERVRQRMRRIEDHLGLSSDWICCALM